MLNKIFLFLWLIGEVGGSTQLRGDVPLVPTLADFLAWTLADCLNSNCPSWSSVFAWKPWAIHPLFPRVTGPVRPLQRPRLVEPWRRPLFLLVERRSESDIILSLITITIIQRNVQHKNKVKIYYNL